MGGQRLELVGGADKRQACQVGDFPRDPLGEFGMSVQAGPHGGSAERQLVQPGQAFCDTPAAALDLCGIPGELLAQRQRDRVHQVGPPDLDDGREFAALVPEEAGQCLHDRQQVLRERRGRGDVHGRGERVVGGLRHIDVVIRVDRILAAEDAARQLYRPIGDHLVDVHIGVGAAAGLPDSQGKMVIEPAFDDLLGGLDDQIRFLLRQQARLLIDERGGLLQHSERHNNLVRHLLGADVEIPERARRLGPIVGIFGHFHFAQRILFGPERHPIPRASASGVS